MKGQKIKKLDLTGQPTWKKLAVWADLLEAIPEDRINMGRFIEDERMARKSADEITDCGTACCAWGWAGVFFSGLNWGNRGGQYASAPILSGSRFPDCSSPEMSASHFFGISLDETRDILYLHSSSPKQKVVEHIRKLSAKYKAQA